MIHKMIDGMATALAIALFVCFGLLLIFGLVPDEFVHFLRQL